MVSKYTYLIFLHLREYISMVIALVSDRIRKTMVKEISIGIALVSDRIRKTMVKEISVGIALRDIFTSFFYNENNTA